MKARKRRTADADRNHVAIQRLDDQRYAVTVDGIVRYVGTEQECERRIAILAPKSDRAVQDQALARVGQVIR